MSDSIILARLKRSGKTFELSIDPIKAIQFKEAKLSNVAEALMSENIFIDAKRGQLASETELQQFFNSTNKTKIAEMILQKGEIQSSSEQRSIEREQKRKKLVQKIHTITVDPKTNLPHPITRINAALNEAKIHLNDHKTINQLFDDIISKLRPILPLKIEQKQLIIVIEPKYLGATNSFICSQKIIKEQWTNEGNWQVIIELPAGLVQDTIDTLNNKTSGSCVITFKE